MGSRMMPPPSSNLTSVSCDLDFVHRLTPKDDSFITMPRARGPLVPLRSKKTFIYFQNTVFA